MRRDSPEQSSAEENEPTHEEDQAEHARRFRPERSLLVIAGRIEPAQALKLAEAAFGDWQGQGTAPAEIPAPAAQATPAFVLLQRDGSVQSTLRLGRPGIAATSPDYVPLRLASTIIGGGFSSRINQNLREVIGMLLEDGQPPSEAQFVGIQTVEVA